MMLLKFRRKCEEVCPNETELCDIVIDLCYSSSRSRQFAWDICGEVIIENLLKKNDYSINYPVMTRQNGEFEFGGEQFIMRRKKIRKGETPL